MCHNLRCVCGRSNIYIITTSTDLSAFIPLLRSQILFQGYRNVLIIVYFLTLRLGRSSSFLRLCISESPKIAPQLVVRTPLQLYASRRHLISPTGCPPKLEFPVTACLCFNAITSSTPTCLSDLLQLYFPSGSLHSCTGIRLLPLPPCRCRTGGDCAFSRSGLLSGARCHFTSGM